MAYQYWTALEIVREGLRVAAAGGDATMAPSFSLFTPTDPTALQYQALLSKAVSTILGTVHTPEALGLRKRTTVLSIEEGGDPVGEYPLPDDVFALLGVSALGVQYVNRFYEAGADVPPKTYYNRLGSLVVEVDPPAELVLDYVTSAVYRSGEAGGTHSRLASDSDVVLIDQRLVVAAFLSEYARNTNDSSMATYMEEYKYTLMQITGDAGTPSATLDVRGVY